MVWNKNLELKMFHKRLQVINDYRNECEEIRLILSDTYLDHKSRCRRGNIDYNQSYIFATSPLAACQPIATTDYDSSDTSSSIDPLKELTANSRVIQHTLLYVLMHGITFDAK